VSTYSEQLFDILQQNTPPHQEKSIHNFRPATKDRYCNWRSTGCSGIQAICTRLNNICRNWQ